MDASPATTDAGPLSGDELAAIDAWCGRRTLRTVVVTAREYLEIRRQVLEVLGT